MSKKEVRIVLVGSEGVGKSSIITALISETFQEKVAPVVPPLTIPPEVTSEKITTHIIDTSSRPSDYPSVEEEIRQADCVIVVYAVDDQTSFSKVKEFWLPEIRRIRMDNTNESNDQLPPVVLVGNKIDVRGSQITNDFFESEIKPIMNEFREVESCVECSAKRVLHIHEVFFFSKKAILYPTSVLFDHSENKLKPRCVNALKRIFHLSDRDKDDELNDHELGLFQEKCFGVPLQPSEITAVKQVIQAAIPEGVTSTGLKLVGFLYLHRIFIQKGKSEATWSVLRKFGYGDNLKLREDYLNPPMNVKESQTVELSTAGYKFFTSLFKQFDKDQDGALSHTELENLFSFVSPGIPWGKQFTENAVTNEQSFLTLQGFLAQWSMTTLLDYKTTLQYLAYLGFDDDTRLALTIQKRRKSGINKRNVFLTYVFGSQECGKTNFLRKFLGKSFEDKPSESGNLSVCNTVYVDKIEKYIVLQEFEDEKAIINSEEKMSKCDLCCFLYDSHNPKSFAYVASLQQQIFDNNYEVPSLYFATKADLGPVKQSYSISPEEYCKQQHLPQPKFISFVNQNEEKENEIYTSLVHEIYDFWQTTSSNKWTLFLGAGVLAVVLVGGAFYAWKYTKH